MSFRYSTLRLAISAKALSYLGDTVATIALMFRLAPHGTAAVAGLLACNLAPIVALSGVAGRVADAIDERILLAGSACLQALLCASLAWLDGPAPVFVVVALLGVAQAVNGATWQAVIPALAPSGRLTWALSRSQVATTVAAIGAPAVGGLLVGASGTRAPLLVDAAAFAAVAVGGVLLGRVRTSPDPDRDRSGGLAIVRRSPVLRATIGLAFWALLLGSMVNVVEVFLVRSVLHAGAVVYGLAGAAYAVGALLGALWAGRFTAQAAQARVLVRAAVAIGGGLALMGLAPDVAFFVAVAVAAGAANGVINVCTASLLMGTAAADQRGRVGAVMGAAVSGAQLAAYGACTAIALVLGPREIFVLGGALAALAALTTGRRLREAVGIARSRTSYLAHGTSARRDIAHEILDLSAIR